MEMIVRQFDGEGRVQESIYQLHEIDESLPNLPQELRDFKRNIKGITFLTGNKNKLSELQSTLDAKKFKLTIPEQKIELAEIQDSSILNMVQDKCQRAYELVNRSKEVSQACQEVILVEDTCLNFQALNGMPGPYVKWFLEAIGPEGLFKMLAGFTNKSAEAVCIYALMGLLPAATTDGNDSPAPSSANQQRRPILLFFSGIARGQIVEPRRANATSGWGWDPIFEEERSRLTFAEMSAEMKSKFSHRASALTILRKFLEI